MLFNIGTGSMELDALIFIGAILGTYIALPIFLFTLGGSGAQPSWIDGGTRAALFPLSFAWIFLHAAFLDLYWHLGHVWISMIGLALFVAISWWIIKMMDDPWYEFSRTYDRLKIDYDAVERLPTDKARCYFAEATVLSASDYKVLFDPYNGHVSDGNKSGGVKIVKTALEIVEQLYEQDRAELLFPVKPAYEPWRDKSYYDHVLKEAQNSINSIQGDLERVVFIGDGLNAALVSLIQMLSGRASGPFELMLVEVLPSVEDAIGRAMNWLWSDEAKALKIGETVRATFANNRRIASDEVLNKPEIAAGNIVYPAQYAKQTGASPADVARTYLDGTGFLPIFLTPLSWGFSEVLRAAHGVIVAGSDGGKSQTLENLILADLDRDDPPGMVVIDSKAGEGDLLQRIARLEEFHPDHGRLRDRLVIIDPRERPALNLFDVGVEDLDDEAVNDVVSSLEYFFGSLLGSDITGKQSVIFIPLVELMCHISKATLNDFINVLDDITPYLDHVRKLQPETRDFLLSKEYQGTHYKETKNELRRRLRQITLRRTLSRMFAAPQNSLNIATALNEGKIILVSTEVRFLKPELSAMFGRYFISRVISAALDRGRMVKGAVKPARIYIDECAPYVDEKLDEMLTTLRSYGLGAMVAFQDVPQMGRFVHTIQSNTAIKLMSTVSHSDARAFADDMRTDSEFIMENVKPPGDWPPFGKFACYTRGMKRAVSIQVPFGALDKRPRMIDYDYHRMRMFNRHKLMAEPTPTEPVDDFEGETIDGTAEEVVVKHQALPAPKRAKKKSASTPRDDDATAASDTL